MNLFKLTIFLFLAFLQVHCANNEQPLFKTGVSPASAKDQPNNCIKQDYTPLLHLSTEFSKSQDKTNAEKKLDSNVASIFYKDGSQSFLENHDWYHYTDAPDHMIWSFFDIFVVKTQDDQLYRLQFLSYYDLLNPTLSGAAVITLRVQPQNGEIKEVSLDARGCGNPFVDPEAVENCLADPTQRRQVYVTLNDLCYKKMTKEEAQEDNDWNLSFDRTEVLARQGDSLSNSTLVGLLYRDPKVNSAKGGFVTPLKEKLADQFSARDFVNHRIPEVFALQSPKSIKNMIQSEDWATIDDDKITAQPKNSWLIRSTAENIYHFNIPKIEKTPTGSTKMTFNFGDHDIKSSTTSAPHQINLELDPFNDRIDLCIDFDSAQIVDCKKERDQWEIRFRNRPKKGKIRWSITTQAGAQGPLVSDE